MSGQSLNIDLANYTHRVTVNNITCAIYNQEFSSIKKFLLETPTTQLYYPDGS